MTIEIKQLRYAVATADTSSFSRAASALNVKQSTLSKRIALLEDRLGIALFERSTRGAIPTESGKVFLEVARRIITDVDNLRTTARSVQYGEIGRVVVGFSNSLSIGNLRSLLGEFLERFVDVQLDGVEVGSEQLLSGLQSRIVDVAIHSTDLSGDGVTARTLWSERLMVALPKDHEFANRDTLYWTDLRRETFVLPSKAGGPGVANAVTARLAGQGLRANIISQDTNHNNIMAMVPFGKFLTIIGESAMGFQRSDLVFREIEEPGGHARLDYAAYWREDNDNPALQRFFTLLDERYPAAETF